MTWLILLVMLAVGSFLATLLPMPSNSAKDEIDLPPIDVLDRIEPTVFSEKDFENIVIDDPYLIDESDVEEAELDSLLLPTGTNLKEAA